MTMHRLNSEDFSKFFLCLDILVLTYPYESTHSEVNNNAEIVSGTPLERIVYSQFSLSIVVTFQVFKNQLTIPSTIFGNSIITSAPISWNFQCSYSTNIDISSDEISMDGSPTTGDFSAYGQFDIEMRTVTQNKYFKSQLVGGIKSHY